MDYDLFKTKKMSALNYTQSPPVENWLNRTLNVQPQSRHSDKFKDLYRFVIGQNYSSSATLKKEQERLLKNTLKALEVIANKEPKYADIVFEVRDKWRANLSSTEIIKLFEELEKIGILKVN